MQYLRHNIYMYSNRYIAMRYCFLTNTYLTFKMTTKLKHYKLQLQNGKDINSQLNKYIFNLIYRIPRIMNGVIYH